jgi:Transcriptional regulator, contains sigma factor-related N-terminal domain
MSWRSCQPLSASPGEEQKAQAIHAALIGKRINGLVTEETTARAVLALAS